MADNSIEKRLLAEINSIDEGLALGLLKWILKPTVKKALNKMADDPEYKAALDDMEYASKRIKKLSKKLKDHPNPSFRKLYKKLK